METQTPRNDCYAVLFYVGITKDLQVHVKNGVALNDFLYDFVKATILEVFQKQLTDEMKKDLLEVLMQENPEAMKLPPRKRPPRKVEKLIVAKPKNRRAKRVYPKVAGYRSVYFPEVSEH